MVTDYDATLEAIRLASREIADGEWHGDDHTPNRDIAAGCAIGRISVFPSPALGATVSLDIDGMTEKQALAVLRALSEYTNGR